MPRSVTQAARTATAPLMLSPGSWVTPQVRLIRPLGDGGMARVWAAVHLGRHTQVAVKLMHTRLLRDDTARARFEREAQLISSIESPHMVQILEQSRLADSTPFVVMEWLDGETLAARLERLGKLPARDALSVVLQVARALEAAHGVGVIHRDVKPENVFLLRSEGGPLVKVLDFGIAKHEADRLSVVTDASETLGTPAYMSPEQLRRASSVDRRTDVWSLGVLAYAMLFGELPFQATSYPALCLAIIEGQYRPPSAHGWPPAIDAWFARALARQRDARFATAADAALALAQCGLAHL